MLVSILDTSPIPGEIVPARRDRHGVVVEEDTQATRRGHANDPAAEPRDDGSHSGSSTDAAPFDRESPHYDEPTRLVRRPGRGSSADDETTIVHRPGRGRQAGPEAANTGRRRRRDEPSYEDDAAPSHYDEPTQLVGRGRGSPAVDDEKTILQPPRTQDRDCDPQDPADDPVTGWLVIVDGPGRGRSVELGAGRNEIGRGSTANVKLDFGDREISRNAHAYITYDDEARLWYIQQGGGRNLVRLGDRPVLEPMPLAARSSIRIGRTRLVFVPLCGEDFDWEDVGTDG